jgi:hypothetical protein
MPIHKTEARPVTKSTFLARVIPSDWTKWAYRHLARNSKSGFGYTSEKA